MRLNPGFMQQIIIYPRKTDSIQIGTHYIASLEFPLNFYFCFGRGMA